MDIKSEPVARAVNKELPVGCFFDQAVNTAFQEFEILKPDRNCAYGRLMGIVERGSGTDRVDSRKLSRQHDLVKRLLPPTEAAIDRKGAGDVGAVTVNLCACVYQQQIMPAKPLVVIDVMQNAGILTASNDGRISGILCTPLAKRIFELRFNLVLKHARLASAHRPAVGSDRDCRGFFHCPDFGRTLDEA